MRAHIAAHDTNLSKTMFCRIIGKIIAQCVKFYYQDGLVNLPGY